MLRCQTATHLLRPSAVPCGRAKTLETYAQIGLVSVQLTCRTGRRQRRCFRLYQRAQSHPEQPNFVDDVLRRDQRNASGQAVRIGRRAVGQFETDFVVSGSAGDAIGGKKWE